LEAVDHGDRALTGAGAATDGDGERSTVVEYHETDEVNVSLLVPFGSQDGLELGPPSPSALLTQETFTTPTAAAILAELLISVRDHSSSYSHGHPWLNVAVPPPRWHMTRTGPAPSHRPRHGHGSIDSENHRSTSAANRYGCHAGCAAATGRAGGRQLIRSMQASDVDPPATVPRFGASPDLSRR
jgi:hypothetical protein